MASNKLTLGIDSETVEAAKKYAKKKGDSLSNIVENFLKGLVSVNQIKVPSKKNKRKSVVDELYGAIEMPNMTDEDIKNSKIERLLKKHS